MRILGIETSCDETAAAIVECTNVASRKILANIVWSQIDEHEKFGGVVPELAARAHVEKLDGIIQQALKEAKLNLQDIDAIAASAGPGLVGGLMIGVITAKAIAMSLQKPFIAINHLEAHALTARLTHNVAYPYLLLLVSGGHTQLLIIEKLGKYIRLGSTIDDALGEAFDKTAKLMGVSYPGGAKIEKYAQSGDPYKYNLPRPLKNRADLNFSFSGLKTAVRNIISDQPLNDTIRSDISASFQLAICDILETKVAKAIEYFKEHYPNYQPKLVIAGGVAANNKIRETLRALSERYNCEFIVPEAKLCTDNAAMVAWAGLEHFKAGHSSSLNFSIKARWPLDTIAEPLVGTGRKGAKV